MKYKIIDADSPNELNNKVAQMISNGWKPIGSHQVVIRRVQNRYSGTQHMDSLNQLEYTQTMVQEYVKNVIEVDIAFYHPDDDETIKVYDEEGMREEFEHKLSNLINL